MVQVFDGVEKDKGQDKKTSEEVSGCDEPWKRWRPDNVQAMSPVPQLRVVLVRLGPIDIKDQTKSSFFKHF